MIKKQLKEKHIQYGAFHYSNKLLNRSGFKVFLAGSTETNTIIKRSKIAQL